MQQKLRDPAFPLSKNRVNIWLSISYNFPRLHPPPTRKPRIGANFALRDLHNDVHLVRMGVLAPEAVQIIPQDY